MGDEVDAVHPSHSMDTIVEGALYSYSYILVFMFLYNILKRRRFCSFFAPAISYVGIIRALDTQHAIEDGPMNYVGLCNSWLARLYGCDALNFGVFFRLDFST